MLDQLVEAIRDGWLTSRFDDESAPLNRAAAVQLQELAEMIRELGVTAQEKAMIEQQLALKERNEKLRREAETY
jgi:hypothetical protein